MIIHFPCPLSSSSSLHSLKFLNRVRSHSSLMTTSEARGFHVTTTRKEIVAPASSPLLPLPENMIISVSNLDLLLPPVDINVCFFYKKPLYNTTNDVLKTSLAEALVSYYVLAGEVVANPITGESEILCNNGGVEVVEAAADVELRELNLHDPYQSIAKFVPMKVHGVFAIQITELKCGSLVVGCTFDHRIADAYSMNMFLHSWAQISRSDVPTSYMPSFNRSLLNPRRPLVIDSSVDQMYMPVTSLPLPQETTNPDNILTSRIYYIKADVVRELQTLAGNGKRTKLESFSAFLWKLVAKHAATTTDLKLLNSKLGIVVDGRKKLTEQETNTYFGNVLSVPFDSPSGPGLSRIYGTGSEEGPAFVVSSGKSFPVTRIDFGWGSPVFGSYHLPLGSRTGYVMTIPSPVVDNSAGDWIVYLHLAKGQLKFIEQEAPHVFKPIDNDYLKI
uniref:Uncharacterized protein n=1 Tax=Brassica oleracea var. oleracea TaxID=109376 RepID=A0A0D3AJC4_BRAOL